MDLIFYCTEKSAFGTEILTQLRQVCSEQRLRICGTAEELVRALLRPFGKPLAAVLLLANGEDMDAILQHKELLRSVKVLLVLPDAEDETVAKALLLRPRMMTWPHADGAAGLVSMLKKLQREQANTIS